MVHIGDSTSEGLISPDYEPNPANRIPARYADVGVKQSIMKIVGATSVVESLPGTPNAYDMANQVKQGGFNGCWVLALGTNDTADVYVGSNVSRVQRIQKMMSLIGNQPVMWVEVTSLLSTGPYSEQNMELWNQALQQVQAQYPNMRIYNWPAVAQKSWFINDGIHYTTIGYAHRATDDRRRPGRGVPRELAIRPVRHDGRMRSSAPAAVSSAPFPGPAQAGWLVREVGDGLVRDGLVRDGLVEAEAGLGAVELQGGDHVLEPGALGDPPLDLRDARAGERGGGGADQAAGPGARQPLGAAHRSAAWPGGTASRPPGRRRWSPWLGRLGAAVRGRSTAVR